MPVHVFGNPCDVEKIEAIAAKHNLKVIYDAAHAFGVEYKGKSLINRGDISICSFHATKPFHTIEGGAVIVKDKEVSDKVELIKRFGHQGDDHFMLGINAKASEFQAAMGLVNLKYLGKIIEKRKKAFLMYKQLLDKSFFIPIQNKNIKYNYAYFPVVTRSEIDLLKIIKALSDENISSRRYFYPSLNTLPYLKSKQPCPVSEDIADRVMSLPLFAEIKEEDIKHICEIVNKVHAG